MNIKRILAGLLAVVSLGLWNCQPSEVASVDAASQTSAARFGTDTTGFFCRDSLTKMAVSALPAAVSGYISTNYTGATTSYAAQDDAGNFWVAITQNDQRKTLLFNADATFNKELSGRGKGPGQGGKGGRRDSLTQVAVTDLPAAVSGYITTNFANATITLAALDVGRGYLVMVQQADQKKTLLFNTDGSFEREIVRGLKGDYTAIDVSALPAAVTTYISTNYTGSTIKAAGKSSTGPYKVIVQPATGRPVDLLFAADGTFVQAHRRR